MGARSLSSTIESSHESNVQLEQIFPSVFIRRLWKNKNTSSHAVIVDIAPGGKWLEPDLHEPGPEIVYVISGVLNDGERNFSAGSFIYSPKGSSHVPQSQLGCKLFVFYPEG